MKIDADANGTVEWHEFMNYMLLENQTLSSMKKELSTYVKTEKDDPPPLKETECHAKNITSIIIIYPEDLNESSRSNAYQPGSAEYKKHMKFVTGAQDGKVKIWGGINLKHEHTIPVSSYYVMAICFMTHSKRLVAASADRMISFYDINNIGHNNMNTKPVSRIENLVAVPHCLEYYRWP